MRSKILLFAAICIAGTLLLPAADYTWLASPLSGIWLTDANWDLGAWDEMSTANKAVFGASSQTAVDVNGDVTASSVAVSGADYAFGGTGTLEVNGSFNVEKGIRYSDAALQAEADDLYEQMGAIRPEVSRVTIKPSK